jgi:hypothetical protein
MHVGNVYALHTKPCQPDMWTSPSRAAGEIILTEQELGRLLHPDKAAAEHKLAAKEAAERAFAQQNAAFKVLVLHEALRGGDR